MSTIDQASRAINNLRSDVRSMREMAEAAGIIGLSGMATQLSRLATLSEAHAADLFEAWQQEFDTRTRKGAKQ